MVYMYLLDHLFSKVDKGGNVLRINSRGHVLSTT